MRVIAGRFKGRRLATPKGNRLVRPTAARVKESIFSILGDRVVDVNFLDLCAGTGNIGIEALSRGAKHVTFLEREPRCVRLIERNLETCRLLPSNDPQYRVFRGDVVKGIAHLRKRAAAFEIIYFDPPYGINSRNEARLYTTCLPMLAEGSLLSRDGVLLVEHAKQHPLPESVGELRRSRQSHYGGTVVSFYVFSNLSL